MNQTSISDLIARVQNRIRMRAALKGAAITLIVAVISLIAASLLALKITPGLAGLTALRALPIVLAAASAWLFIWKPTRAKIDSARIARLIEEKCAMEDRLVTAVEFSESPRAASPAIIDRLVKDVSERASSRAAPECRRGRPPC